MTITDIPITPTGILSPDPGWLELRLAAELFARAQVERIAVTNTIRRAEKGGNLPAEWMEPHAKALEATEKDAEKTLAAVYKRVVPECIRQWQENTVGIGAHNLARLLGTTGDPLVAFPHHWEGEGKKRILVADEPFLRSVGQLWQFCGHGAPQRRVRGMTAAEAMALGNPHAKMLVHMMADTCMRMNGVPDKKERKRARSPYRDLYEAVKFSVEDKVHTVECQRCTPKNKPPAAVGTPWKDAHRHNHALRVVGKTILRDLWVAAHGGEVLLDE